MMKWVCDVIMWRLQTRIEKCCSRTRILSPLMKVRQCKCKFVSLKFKVLFLAGCDITVTCIVCFAVPRSSTQPVKTRLN